jgi:hypothetical protein
MCPHREIDTKQDARMASSHLQERREVRYAVAFEIEVSGITAEGEVFHERTFTRNVSEWGCGFVISLELKAANIIAIRRTSAEPVNATGHELSVFEVMRVAKEGDHWLVGAWKMDNIDVWGTELERLAAEEDRGREQRTAEKAEPQTQGRDTDR